MKAKADQRREIVLNRARLDICYSELRRRARQFCVARDRAEAMRLTAEAALYHQKAEALFALSTQIWSGLSTWSILPNPEDDWEEIPKGLGE